MTDFGGCEAGARTAKATSLGTVPATRRSKVRSGSGADHGQWTLHGHPSAATMVHCCLTNGISELIVGARSRGQLFQPREPDSLPLRHFAFEHVVILGGNPGSFAAAGTDEPVVVVESSEWLIGAFSFGH